MSKREMNEGHLLSINRHRLKIFTFQSFKYSFRVKWMQDHLKLSLLCILKLAVVIIICI